MTKEKFDLEKKTAYCEISGESVEKRAKSGIAKQFHRAHFFENNVAIIIHFWDAFFLEKSVPNPCKLGTIAKQ